MKNYNDLLQMLMTEMAMTKQDKQEDATQHLNNGLPVLAKIAETGSEVPYSQESIDADYDKAIRSNNFGSASMPESNYQKLWNKLRGN